jgi:plasmid stabilization system protein ParE
VKATLLVLPRAEAEMLEMSQPDLQRVVETLEFLCEFPQGAQTAGLEAAPELRRAVSGNWLIYYRFEAESRNVLIYTVRHGRRMPPDINEVLPE